MLLHGRSGGTEDQQAAHAASYFQEEDAFGDDMIEAADHFMESPNSAGQRGQPEGRFARPHSSCA